MAVRAQKDTEEPFRPNGSDIHLELVPQAVRGIIHR